MGGDVDCGRNTDGCNDQSSWLPDRLHLSSQWHQLVQGILRRGGVPNIPLAIYSILSWERERSRVGESLDFPGEHIDAADAISHECREPQVSAFSLGAHYCRPREREGKWIFFEGAVCCI